MINCFDFHFVYCFVLCYVAFFILWNLRPFFNTNLVHQVWLLNMACLQYLHCDIIAFISILVLVSEVFLQMSMQLWMKVLNCSNQHLLHLRENTNVFRNTFTGWFFTAYMAVRHSPNHYKLLWEYSAACIFWTPWYQPTVSRYPKIKQNTSVVCFSSIVSSTFPLSWSCIVTCLL